MAVALETGLYLLLPLAGRALGKEWQARRSLAYALPLFCIGLHMAYIARIGGDHFEYRPLDVYWPLLVVSAAAGLVYCAAGCRPRSGGADRWWWVRGRER